MVRTQISMTEQQAESLRRLAALRRKSQAALMREAIENLLADDERHERWERALAATGRFASEPGSTAWDHDEEFAEAVLDKSRR